MTKNIFIAILISLFWGSFCASAQSNWKRADSLTYYNSNDTSSVYRKGNVAISHGFLSPFQNKLMVTDVYKTDINRGVYFSLNEPRLDLPTHDTTQIGLASNPEDSHNTLVVNNYANFKTGTSFTDVHNSTAEINYFRGTTDDLGFRDGGDLIKSASLKIAGNFGNNGRAYKNTEFDLLNLRFFTGVEAGNIATIDNFYGIRLEDFRGLNPNIIQNGWGIFIKPNTLKNYFGGKTGIGTSNVTHMLTIDAIDKPLKVGGLETQPAPTNVLSVNNDGEVFKTNLADKVHSFQVTTSSISLNNEVEIYIHKGGDAVYTLPSPSLRTGKIWSISNVGTGSITTSEAFLEGDTARNTIINKAGANSFKIFSDGTQYIAIK